MARTKIELTFDILNFLNLLNSEDGVIDLANPSHGAHPYGGINAAGKMIYNLATITARPLKFDRDDLRSRWQGQLGFRVRF